MARGRKTNLRIPMAGLDQGLDPKTAQGLLLLENSLQDRRDEFAKRNGLLAATGSYSDENLAVYKGRPVLFGNSGVYALDAAGTAFNKVDDAGFFDVELSRFGVGANALAQVVEVYEGATITCVFYQKKDQVSGISTYHLTTFETASGRQLATATLANGRAHIFAVGTNIVYVAPGASLMSWGTINESSGAISALTACTGSSATAGNFDVCVVDADNFAIVHEESAASDAELIVVTDAFGTPAYNIGAVTSGESVHAVACWLQSATRIAVAVATTVSQDVDISTWDTGGTVQDSPIPIWAWSDADDKCHELCGIASGDGGTVYMTLGPMQSPDDDDLSCRIIQNTYTGVGGSFAAGSETDPWQEGCRLLTQCFSDAAGGHYVVVQRQGDFLSGLNKCCMVMHSSTQIVARFLMDKAVSNLSVNPGYLGLVDSPSADSWTFGAAMQAGYETSVPVAVQLSKTQRGLKAVEAHGLLVLPGAHPWVFTGQDVVELGFVHPPGELRIDPAETLDVLNDLVAMYEAHRVRSISDSPPTCHDTAGGDTINAITVTNPATTLQEAIALANDLKAKYEAHRADATEHNNTDTVNSVAAADCTDYDTLQTLLAELLTDYNAHRVEAAGPGQVHYNNAANQNDTVNVPTETMGGAMEEGNHGFQVVYERTLTSGHRDQSAPSPNASIDNDANEGVEVVVGELHHTKVAATLALYRTEADLSVWHRSARQANNKNAYEATIPDAQADDDIAEEPYVYTTGNVLEHLPPPPSRVFWVHQERLFCVNREDESQDVRYSKPFVDGEGIAFNDVLSLRVPAAGGRIVAGASMLGRLVLFKKDRIYTSYGTGYNNIGSGSGYSAPEMIQSAIGCVDQKTLVETPLGLMFLSEDGIYLLDQKWNLQAVGRSVKTLTDANVVTGVGHVKDRHYVIWSTLAGDAVVYDYLHGTWSSFTNYAGEDIAVDDNSRTWLKDASTTVHYEDRDVWTDGSPAAAVNQKIRSAWIATDEYQKLHAISVMGANRSDHRLRIKIALDYRLDANGGPFWEYDVTIDTNALPYSETSDHYGAGAASTAEDALLAKVHIARRCRSFLIEVSDETRPGGSTVTKGFSVTGLDLLVSPKSGLFTPGSARQAT